LKRIAVKEAFLILSLLAFISSVSTQIAWLSLEERGAVKAPEMMEWDTTKMRVYEFHIC